MNDQSNPATTTDLEVIDVTPEPPQEPELEREDKFIRNLAVCHTVREAALLAGYSETVAKTTIYSKLKSRAFQDKLREHYKGTAASYLPQIASLEGKALKHLDSNIEDLPKFAHTLKQIKQSAGVLSQDSVPGINLVKIDNIQVLMATMQEDKE